MIKLTEDQAAVLRGLRPALGEVIGLLADRVNRGLISACEHSTVQPDCWACQIDAWTTQATVALDHAAVLLDGALERGPVPSSPRK